MRISLFTLKTLITLIILIVIVCEVHAQAFKKYGDAKSQVMNEIINRPYFINNKKPGTKKNLQPYILKPTGLGDSCTTTIFRLVSGKKSVSEKINDLHILNSNEIIIAGSSEINSINKDALIAKFKNTGTLLWSNTYGNNNFSESITKIKQTAEGDLIAIGTTENISTYEKTILIISLSSNGNVLWTKNISVDINASTTAGIDIIQLSNGDYAFTGHTNSFLIYGRLSSTGNLLWYKTIMVNEIQRSISITEEYDGLYVVSTGKDSGYSVMNVLKVNFDNGNIIWNDKLGGPSQNEHFIAQSMEYINLRPRIVGIRRKNSSTEWNVFRCNINATSQIESVETYAFDTPVDSTGNSVLTPWAEVLGFSSTANSKDVYVFKHVPDAPVRWKYKYADNASKNVVAIDRMLDGGFVIAGNQLETDNVNSDIFIYKVDSAGLQPSCGGTAFNVSSVISEPPQPYSNIPYKLISTGVNVSSYSLSNSVSTMDTVYACKTFYCPQSTSTDTCLQTFFKTYRSSSFCDLSFHIVNTPDGNIVTTGVMRDNPSDATTDRGTIIKMDKSGNILKRLKTAPESSSVLDIIVSKDKRLLVPAFVNGKLLLNKLDNDLNVIWTKSYALGGVTGFYYNGILQSEDSSIFLMLEYSTPYPPNILLMKFSKNGDFIWQKNYLANETFAGFFNTSMAELNGSVYFKTETVVDNYYPGIVIFRVDETDGSIVWSKYYNNEKLKIARNSRLVNFNDRILLTGGVETAPPVYIYHPALIIINDKGEVEKSKIYGSDITTFDFSKAIASKDKGLIVDFDANDYTTNPFIYNRAIGKLDKDLNVIFCRRYFNPNYHGTADLSEANDGYIYTTGYMFYTEAYNYDAYVKKHSPDGKSGQCLFSNLNMQDSAIKINVMDQHFNYAPDILITSVNEPLVMTDYDINQSQVYCNTPNTCNNIKITGPKIVCNLDDTVKFSISRNANCTAPISFIADNSSIQIILSNDSSVFVKFKKDGPVKLYAEISSGCAVINDSLNILVHSQSQKLDLGADLQICGTNYYTLHAGNNFSSYTWQDNSSDSLYIISKAGLYYVTVKDYCNNFYSDTVNVVNIPPPPLYSGADTFKCNKDSVQLNATPGFVHYSWTPNSTITDASSAIVKVFPSVTTTYYLSAEKNPGCISEDTVTITVYNTSEINLGNDTSICSGDTITLNGGKDFDRWHWSTGDSSQIIKITKNALYSIISYDKHGCFSTDDFKILNLYSIPAIKLNKDTLLCKGETKVLDAGNGFKNYLWDNQTNKQKLEISRLGKYWVTVTDYNNCRNSDTTEIKIVADIPSGFLVPDTSLCSYESITLSTTPKYNNYLWSTGNTTSAILVNNPGEYWLSVTDKNGCNGKERVVISLKDCPEGIFFPTAFSPNANALNDYYKPVVFGNPSNYSFIILNRFGQKIFETTDFTKGWNGRVKGIDQDSGAYVWVCTYRFSNGITRTKKGSMVLVR